MIYDSAKQSEQVRKSWETRRKHLLDMRPQQTTHYLKQHNLWFRFMCWRHVARCGGDARKQLRECEEQLGLKRDDEGET